MRIINPGRSVKIGSKVRMLDRGLEKEMKSTHSKIGQVIKANPRYGTFLVRFPSLKKNDKSRLFSMSVKDENDLWERVK